MRLSTDGSAVCLAGGAGKAAWAAVTPDGTFIGSAAYFASSYDAELMGLLEAVDWIVNTGQLYTYRWRLFCDNEAAVNAFGKKPKSKDQSAFILLAIWQLLQQCSRCVVTTEWLKGHNGNFFNGQADAAAKKGLALSPKGWRWSLPLRRDLVVFFEHTPVVCNGKHLLIKRPAPLQVHGWLGPFASTVFLWQHRLFCRQGYRYCKDSSAHPCPKSLGIHAQNITGALVHCAALGAAVDNVLLHWGPAYRAVRERWDADPLARDILILGLVPLDLYWADKGTFTTAEKGRQKRLVRAIAGIP